MKRAAGFLGIALAACLLFGSSIAVYAQAFVPPMPRGIENPRIVEPPVINMPEIHRIQVDMSVYEGYGLSYNEARRGYLYNGKLVGLFVDKQGRGISYLSRNGEIHVKVLRDSAGNPTGLAELSPGEVSEITAEMDTLREDLFARTENLMAEMQSLRTQMLTMPARPLGPGRLGTVEPPAPELHRNEMIERLEQHMLELNERMRERMRAGD